MSGVRIRVDVDDAAVRAALKNLKDNPLRRRDWDRIGQSLVTGVIDRFERGVGPDGQRWPESRRARVQGGQTLVDTSRLRDSITHRASDDGVEVGTNVVYAAIHQFGGRIEPKAKPKLVFRLADGGWARVDHVDMPARPFLGVDHHDRGAIEDAVAAAIQRAAA